MEMQVILLRHLKKFENMKKQLKKEKKKEKSLKRQTDVLLNTKKMLKVNNIEHNMANAQSVLLELETFKMKNIDAINRLMHTLELLENNQTQCHNLMAINDATTNARQINQMQAESVNILYQEMKDLYKNIQEFQNSWQLLENRLI